MRFLYLDSGKIFPCLRRISHSGWSDILVTTCRQGQGPLRCLL